MPRRKMIVQVGMGTDIRGADPTKAAVRALRDALWHNSLTIGPACGMDNDAMEVAVRIGVPHPESVDRAAVAAVLPHGTGTVEVVKGGLEIRHAHGTTLMAQAAATVYLDIPEAEMPA